MILAVIFFDMKNIMKIESEGIFRVAVR